MMKHLPFIEEAGTRPLLLTYMNYGTQCKVAYRLAQAGCMQQHEGRPNAVLVLHAFLRFVYSSVVFSSILYTQSVHEHKQVQIQPHITHS